jgi:glycosyltransferase involved in cell wall biosynthesis
MKLLFITQKVDRNDSVLGAYHEWIRSFAQKLEFVTVICLQKGESDLPSNVKVLSLGKEKLKNYKIENLLKIGNWILKIYWRVLYMIRFYRLIWNTRQEYDSVFVHMNPEYVILGGLLWKLWDKKIGFWYAHGAVNLKLRLAEKLADIIFTSTKSGFRIKSRKVKIVGQGIDSAAFQPQSQKSKVKSQKFTIINVGRISPIKDYETLIKAIEVLIRDGIEIEVCVVGDIGLPEQAKYLESLKKLAEEKKLENVIHFVGPVSNEKLVGQLQRADLFVNMSQTGSLDKAILEAMACGLPVLTCNEALVEVLGDYKEMLMYPQKDFIKLAEKIKFIMNLNPERREEISRGLREIVAKNHSLNNLAEKIIALYGR